MVRKQQAVLEELADHAADAVPRPPPVMDACGALVAPALELVGEAIRGYTAKGLGQLWRVREVAALSGLRVLDARRGGGGSDAVLRCGKKLRQLEALREPKVVQKQLKLVQCRTLHAELAQCSCNIKADENGKFIVSETSRLT